MSSPLAVPGQIACVVCKQPVAAEYFLAGSQIVCPSCKVRVESSRPPAAPLPESLFGATALGFGAAILAAAGWAALVFAVHIQLGIVAIGVGWLVGTAVRRGARGNSGMIFQGIAIVLTVCAIVWSMLPLLLQGASMAAERSGTPLDPATLGFVVLAGPFLSYVAWVERDPLTLLFLAIAVYQAWKQNVPRVIRFTGPHRVAGAIDFSRP